MPFDGKSSVGVQLARLEILCDISSKNMSENQDRWATCLWSEARGDRRLRALGIGQFGGRAIMTYDRGAGPDYRFYKRQLLGNAITFSRDVCEFFGITEAVFDVAFGPSRKREKLPHLRRALETLKAEASHAV